MGRGRGRVSGRGNGKCKGLEMREIMVILKN
jgi:hypothetical protein